MQFKELIEHFNLSGSPVDVRSLTGGHENETYSIICSDGSALVMQKINTVFYRKPLETAANILTVSEHLAKNGETRLQPVLSRDGRPLVFAEKGYYRAYKLIRNAKTMESQLSTLSEIKDFGHALGRFNRALLDLDADKLYHVIPDYHNTPKRFADFRQAELLAPKKLLESCAGERSFIAKREKSYSALLDTPIPARAVHSGASIDNCIFSAETGRAVCMADYDTLMPGILAFDFGTAAASCSRLCADDEKDLRKVGLSKERFVAFVRGYLAELEGLITAAELQSLVMGARMMSLELGMRYLTDYLIGNTRFVADYPDHNLVRARVQLLLCKQIESNYSELCDVIVQYAR